MILGRMKNNNLLKDIDKYYQPDCFHGESKPETRIVNGVPHTVMNCTMEEYVQRTGAKRMEDIKWTQVNEVITKSDEL